MSIKEKKTLKGNSFAIVKFSDLSKVFELFLFLEIFYLLFRTLRLKHENLNNRRSGNNYNKILLSHVELIIK